jgi:hypothetical protein
MFQSHAKNFTGFSLICPHDRTNLSPLLSSVHKETSYLTFNIIQEMIKLDIKPQLVRLLSLTYFLFPSRNL